ncbi:alpha/beta-hydrolase [Sistotremastrum suecicum HHB10207 ss-3]|uniref:Carboxylic ester hydrolase n=1 Tax=Sistotremastrum suecicum HHB10207 ss-3 TaxID=1314776 RepID=A0A166E2L8_9AGAM|nr:alpha/beta-hydrolase [Sistotremastrum suecicum HHB10207 ss-3]
MVQLRSSLQLAAAVTVLSARATLATPTPASVGSDLNFIFPNDLNWPTAGAHLSTILISARSNADAITACGKLSEGLLLSNGTYFKSDIENVLNYRVLEGDSILEQYWIASSKKGVCEAVSHLGILPLPCDLKLPAFCSSSAPNKVSGSTDLSTQWQTEVTSGKLQVTGTRDHLSFRFLGIPYADPFQRWTYSSVYSGSGAINALNFGNHCYQLYSGGSEDCLFLNIFTPYLPNPSTKSKSLKPVMFWIHGGAFTGGEGSDGIFDGGNLASRGDVVVVTINYRLSTLGFLALNDGVTNGNYGLADMITALKWVQEHIADFGGDPSRVTIFGQSAGAGAVRALLAAPPAFGLYTGAIAESNLDGFGYASTYSNYYTIAQEVSVAAGPLVTAVGCSGASNVLACLRAVPAQTLISAPTAPRFIVVDGKYIQTNQLEVNGKGPANKNAHVIFGWMEDDGADFIGSYPAAGTTAASAIAAVGISSTETSSILSSGLFPVPNGANSTLDVFNVTSRVATDGEFRCLDQATVAAAAKHNVFQSVWTYEFQKSYDGYEPFPAVCEPPKTATHPNGDPSQPYFKCHSGELYYVFGTLGQSQLPFRDSNDLLFSQLSVDAWTAFARTYNPNPSAAFLIARGYSTTADSLLKYGTWQPVTPSNPRPLRILDVPLKQVGYLEQPQCNLLGYPISYYY